ncbi:MAG: ATP-binding protein [Candidatus Hodarchaeales archaeon]
MRSWLDSLEDNERNRAISFAAFFIVLFAVYFLCRALDWEGSTELHTIMEVIATLLALFVGIVALARYYSKKDNTILFIGVGFIGTAFLDGYHAVVTSEWFADTYPSPPSHLIPWSWNASRTYLGILMLLSWWIWHRELKTGGTGQINPKMIYSVVGLLTLTSFLFFFLMPLPPAYYSAPSIFPEAKYRPEEFISAIVFFLAFVGYFNKGAWKEDHLEYWLVISLIVNFMGQAMFMSSSGKLFDTYFDAAHLLKKLAYICVLIGLLISMYFVFQAVDTAEQELKRQAAELARSNKELEMFAYIASHDLQEPLRVISGYLQLLESRYEGKFDEEGREFISFAVDGAGRLQNMIEDLLTFSRVGTANRPFKPTDSNAVLDYVMVFLRNVIVENEAEIDRTPLPIVMADETQLEQLFQNLISNAIKFRKADVPPKVQVGASCKAGEWLFFVKDNGIGIESQYLERIFRLFERLHGRTKYEGTGLGLSICKKIVERHGGRIWVESAIGEGTVFYFTLPSVKEEVLYHHG